MPSKTLRDPDSEEKSPPCSQTITGRLALSRSAGVQTFRIWQSSLISLSKVQEAKSDPSGPRDCGDIGPKVSASRTPVQAAGTPGAMNRFAVA